MVEKISPMDSPMEGEFSGLRSSGHCSSVLAFWDWGLGTDHLPVPDGGSWERVLGWRAQYANLRNHRIGHHAFDWADHAVTSSIPNAPSGLIGSLIFLGCFFGNG